MSINKTAIEVCYKKNKDQTDEEYFKMPNTTQFEYLASLVL